MAVVENKEAPAKQAADAPVDADELKLREQIERRAKRFIQKKRNLEVDKFFRATCKLEGSDLHLKAEKPPYVRVGGTLKPLNMPPITPDQMVRLCFPLMDERNFKIFEETGGADFAHVVDVDGVSWRFRVNLLQQMGKVGMVARRVNNWIPDFEGLFLPDSIERLCHFDQGMVLLAGVTGSGKSTTIASMLNYINRKYNKHILTLEDPVEFVFSDEKCLINQREIGMDVIDFGIGMKHAVREDPDVMLVGEMRDEETFLTAIHAAETGHLVFGTIHASSAPSTIGRILDLFPESMHPALRSAIAMNMKGIISQKLLKSIKPGVSRGSDRRDHDLQRHDSEACSGRKGFKARRRHPHVRGGRDARFYDELEPIDQGRFDRPRDRIRGRPQPRSPQNGPQGHRRFRPRHPVARTTPARTFALWNDRLVSSFRRRLVLAPHPRGGAHPCTDFGGDQRLAAVRR